MIVQLCAINPYNFIYIELAKHVVKSIMVTTNYACAAASPHVFLFIVRVKNYILCRNGLGFPGTVEEI